MTEVRLARSPPTSGDRRRLHHRSVYMASAQAALGDTEEALTFLREAVRDRGRRVMTSLRTDPVWDVMRSDPGFVSLMREIRNQLSGRGGRGGAKGGGRGGDRGGASRELADTLGGRPRHFFRSSRGIVRGLLFC